MKTALRAGLLWVLVAVALPAADEAVRVASLAELVRAGAGSGQTITMAPGVYRMADYLTADVLQAIRAGVDRALPRPPVPMLVIRGSDNRFGLRGVVLEIDTALYRLLPPGGYTRCLIIAGRRNRFEGLTIRSTGADQGSGGNLLSVAGEGNTLEDFTLHVRGSFPYGYGDLLGKGGPNLVPLQKQSGVQVLGAGTTLRRCRVSSRAFGHCFYIQAGENIRFEDCLAEGEMRSTTEMLRDTRGPAFELGFRSVYENRDGRYVITPGYMKSLVEDGFRTYPGAGSVTLINCTARHTRAGFEIGARDDSPTKSVIENGVAVGCERAFLLGSNVVVRRSRGDVVHGPLLYLRGGRDSDIELECIGGPPVQTVHVLATVAGTRHRVRLSDGDTISRPHLPILLGFGMPEHGEMASPIRPAPAARITLQSEIATALVIAGDLATEVSVQSKGRQLDEAALRRSPGSWNQAPRDR